MLVGSGTWNAMAEDDAKQAGSKDELFLVKDGQALAPIVVFKDAPPFTRRAVSDPNASGGR